MQEHAEELLWINTDRCAGWVCFKGTRLAFVHMVQLRASYGDLDKLKADYQLSDAQWELVEREHEHTTWQPRCGRALSSYKAILSLLPDEPKNGGAG